MAQGTELAQSTMAQGIMAQGIMGSRHMAQGGEIASSGTSLFQPPVVC